MALPPDLIQRLLPFGLPLALVLPSALATGCRAEITPLPQPPEVAAVRLHWPVAPPPALDPGAPVLRVALADHLKAPSPLVLTSAAGMLTLVAPDGARYQSPRLVLHWRKEPLASPWRLRRLVLGPFASYESASAAAARWRLAGASPVIAHPQDWEVWAAGDAPRPDGLGAVRLVEQQVTHRQVLELRRESGPVLFRAPLKLEAPQGLRWQGGVFAGPFQLQPDAYGSWTLVEHVPLERYLQGVVPHEIGAASPAVALAAQSVLARTWALRNLQRFAVDGYHLCADTQCQVYDDPRLAGPTVRQAIARTRHQVLTWQGRPIHAVYHATNGGVAAGFEEVWSGSPLPYLKPQVDAPPDQQARYPLPLASAELSTLLRSDKFYGAGHPRFRWTRSLDAADLQRALQRQAPQLGTPRHLSVLERGASGRVLALEIRGSAVGDPPIPATVVLRLDAIRRHLRQLPSTLFELEPQGPGVWRFVGGGFGHGAGLSQAGAIDLARRGWTLSEVLQHYYPGTQMLPLSAIQADVLGGAP